MKRYSYFLLLFTALLLIALPGCGKQAASSGGENSAEEQTTLTTENDTFQLLMLDRMIQTPDTGVTELLGNGDDQTYDADGELATRVYHGTLFDQNVSYTVFFALNDVTSAIVTFPSQLDTDAVTALISKQLDLEPKEDGSWHTDTALVTLETTDGHTEIAFRSYSITKGNS